MTRRSTAGIDLAQERKRSGLARHIAANVAKIPPNCSESELATKAADAAAMGVAKSGDEHGDDLAGTREGVVFRSVSARGWTLRSRRGLTAWLPSVKLRSAEPISADWLEHRIEALSFLVGLSKPEKAVWGKRLAC